MDRLSCFCCLSLHFLANPASLLLIFTAVVLATALNRLVRLFQRFRIGRGIAIFLSVGLLLLLLGGFFVVVVPPFLEQLQELVKIAPQGLETLRSWTGWLQNLIPEQVVQDLRNLEGLPSNFNRFYLVYLVTS